MVNGGKYTRQPWILWEGLWHWLFRDFTPFMWQTTSFLCWLNILFTLLQYFFWEKQVLFSLVTYAIRHTFIDSYHRNYIYIMIQSYFQLLQPKFKSPRRNPRQISLKNSGTWTPPVPWNREIQVEDRWSIWPWMMMNLWPHWKIVLVILEWYGWWFRNPANQLRVGKFPMIYRVLCIQTVVGLGISSMLSQL